MRIKDDAPSTIGARRLLWAISHQTLVRNEVPLLESAGLIVVAEEPDLAYLWFLDALDYPQCGSADPEFVAGRAMRLWPRNGLVTDAEAEYMNATFEAIMVSTRLDVAVNIRSWFHGTVLFRHFGELSVVKSDPRFDTDRADLSEIVYVPIMPSLLADPLARRFGAAVLLRSMITLPSAALATGDLPSAGRPRLGLYAALLPEGTPIFEWAKSLAAGLPDVDVLVLGLTPDQILAAPSLPENIDVVPRLASAEYWRMFRSLEAMVYPHQNPRHSHYIPYEAIALGMPCFVVSGSSVAADLEVACPRIRSRDLGIFENFDEILEQLPSLLDESQVKRIHTMQAPLLEGFTPRALEEQARAIAALIRPKPLGEDARRLPIAPPVPIPSAHGVCELDEFRQTGQMVLSPAAVVAAETIGWGITGGIRFAEDPDIGPCLELAAGPPHHLRLGLPALRFGDEVKVRISIRTSDAEGAPGAVFVSKMSEFVETAFADRPRPATAGEQWWDAQVTISPQDEVVIAIMGLHSPLRLAAVELTVLSEVAWLQGVVEAQRAELERSTGETNRTRDELAGARDELAGARDELAGARDELARMRRDLDAAVLDAERAGAWGADLEARLVQVAAHRSTRLLASLHRFSALLGGKRQRRD